MLIIFVMEVVKYRHTALHELPILHICRLDQFCSFLKQKKNKRFIQLKVITLKSLATRR